MTQEPALEVPVYFGMKAEAATDYERGPFLFLSRRDFHLTIGRHFQCRFS